jgi:hypothetical protein
METTLEQRLTFLEARVRLLEGLLDVAPAPAPASERTPFLPAPKPEEPPAPSEFAPGPDLEEVLGGRVLGWLGGIAVAIAAIFFVVMAVRNGWIGEAARMELAFAALPHSLPATSGSTSAGVTHRPRSRRSRPASPRCTRATRRRRSITTCSRRQSGS